MKFFLDTEFNGLNGELISLALVPYNKLYPELYIVVDGYRNEPLQDWVAANVIPILEVPDAAPQYVAVPDAPGVLEKYFKECKAQYVTTRYGLAFHPEIISDWPDDIKYFCQSLIEGPGEMIETSQIIRFRLWRVDTYPTKLEGAVRHNALWDARALRYYYEHNA